MLAAVATVTFALLVVCLGAWLLAVWHARACRDNGCQICGAWSAE